MLKTIHLLLGTLLTGIAICSYLLICYTKNRSDKATIIKISIKTDQTMLIALILLFLSGTLIVPVYHWNYHTPWIIAAYTLLSGISVLWVANIYLKKMYLKSSQTHSDSQKNLMIFKHQVLFHACNLLMIAMLVLIIKDAVTKQTWL